MGFEDRDADILEKAHLRRKNCMSSILYKQAGNSVVVDVLESILRGIERFEKWGFWYFNTNTNLPFIGFDNGKEWKLMV